MIDSLGLACTIYVDGPSGRDELSGSIARSTKAEAVGTRLLATNELILSVRENEQVDDVERLRFPMGYFAFEYAVGLEFEEGVVKAQAIDMIDQILAVLWAAGWAAVADCAYSDDLINGGGVNRTDLPWP